MIVMIIFWLVFSLVAANIASQKGLSGFKYFMLSVVLTPFIGLVAAIAASPKESKPEEKQGEAEEAIKAIKIGEQVWMAENLNVSTFCNGDPIPEAKTKEEWEKAGRDEMPAWCYFDNDPETGKKYGKLYNWFAVNDPRGLGPENWHIPTKEEFAQLMAGQTCKEAYAFLIEGGASGFSSLLGGFRNADGSFCHLDLIGDYWAATLDKFHSAWQLRLSKKHEEVKLNTFYYTMGFSVRCVKDYMGSLDELENQTAVSTGIADKINTIKIGEQVWMAENLNVSTFCNGDPIPEAKTKEAWEKAAGQGTPAWCYYDNNPAYGKKLGKLYNWFAVNDPRGLAPEKWRIPGKDDFALLLKECNNEEEFEDSYHALTEGGSCGFSSPFAGWRHSNGEFYSLAIVAGYWSATPGNDNDAYRLNIIKQRQEVDIDTIYYGLGFSVRCLRA
jgi:uncharacterized protein (TIGR02145 family)